MADKVIHLNERRPSDESEMLLCECGSGYFHLVPAIYPNDTTGLGAVCIDRDLSITGWSGRLICARCGKTLEQAEPPVGDPS